MTQLTQLEAWEARYRQAVEENPGRIGPLTLAQSDVLRCARVSRLSLRELT